MGENSKHKSLQDAPIIMVYHTMGLSGIIYYCGNGCKSKYNQWLKLGKSDYQIPKVERHSGPAKQKEEWNTP